MIFKRKIRNCAGWLLGNTLILLGYIRKAKKESFKKDAITSIYFHNPNKKLFEKIVKWLKKNDYIFISSEQLLGILNKKIPCLKGAVWISLDDGWKGNIDNVLPVVKKYNIPITIFIPTQPVIEGVYWWIKVSRHLSSSSELIEEMKRISEDERVKLVQSIDDNAFCSPDERIAMTIKDIQAISKIPQVTIGGHTVTHPILPNCTENQVEYEIRESQLKLQEWTGKRIKFFAYPNGDFDFREKKYLKKYGYEFATTIVPEFAHPGSDPYLIPRCGAMDDGSFAENLCHALGVWQPVINKIKGFLNITS